MNTGERRGIHPIIGIQVYCSMLIRLIVVLATLELLQLVNPKNLEAKENQPHPFDVVLRISEVPQPLGGPIRVDLDYVNSRQRITFFQMDWRGLPLGLQLRLIDEQGQHVQTMIPGEMDRAQPAQGGMPLPAKFGDLYSIKPNERIHVGFDLSLFFRIKQPGSYRLVLHDSGITLAEGAVRIVRLENAQVTRIEGHCMHFTTEARPFEIPIAIPVKGRLEVGDTPGLGIPAGYAVLRDFLVGTEGTVKAIQMPVPKGTRVQAQALDCRWQVWTVLTVGEEKSLVIWDLKNQHARMAIPWGKHEIELGSTLVRSGSYAKIVIAGIPGQAKLSTLDDASPDKR